MTSDDVLENPKAALSINDWAVFSWAKHPSPHPGPQPECLARALTRAAATRLAGAWVRPKQANLSTRAPDVLPQATTCAASSTVGRSRMKRGPRAPTGPATSDERRLPTASPPWIRLQRGLHGAASWRPRRPGAAARPPASPVAHSFKRRSRSALAMTDTELRLMAAAASIGLSRMPNAGYSTPAASGTPSRL